MPVATAIAVKDGNNAAQTIPTFDDLAGNKASAVSLDSGRQVYRASANFTPQATAAITIISIQGSATRTVRVKRVFLGGVSTAVSASVFQLVRTTALGVGGTTVNPTVALMDTGSAAATAVVAHYTATLKATGTGAGGPIVTRQVGTNVVTTPATAWIEPIAPLFPEAGMPVGQAIVLRGAAQFLEVQNLTPTNLGAGTVLSYIIEWEEDGS